MARLSDQFGRDADHAGRNEVSTFLGRYQRRINEATKTLNKAHFERTDLPTEVEFEYGSDIGKRNALKSISEFLSDAQTEVKESLAALDSGDGTKSS